tara:strand:+ start:1354 stop:1530 length:177 start_codon:yes stop_codon:yes gene_type:complete
VGKEFASLIVLHSRVILRKNKKKFANVTALNIIQLALGAQNLTIAIGKKIIGKKIRFN